MPQQITRKGKELTSGARVFGLSSPMTTANRSAAIATTTVQPGLDNRGPDVSNGDDSDGDVRDGSFDTIRVCVSRTAHQFQSRFDECEKKMDGIATANQRGVGHMVEAFADLKMESRKESEKLRAELAATRAQVVELQAVVTGLAQQVAELRKASPGMLVSSPELRRTTSVATLVTPSKRLSQQPQQQQQPQHQKHQQRQTLQPPQQHTILRPGTSEAADAKHVHRLSHYASSPAMRERSVYDGEREGRLLTNLGGGRSTSSLRDYARSQQEAGGDDGFRGQIDYRKHVRGRHVVGGEGSGTDECSLLEEKRRVS